MKSYSSSAAGYHDLDLPTISIPDLFRTEKLMASPSQAPLAKQSPPPSDLPTKDASPLSGRSDFSQQPLRIGGRGVDTSPFTTYSKILLKNTERHPTIDSDTSSENNDDDGVFIPHNTDRSRRLNPNLVSAKADPPRWVNILPRFPVSRFPSVSQVR